MVLIGLLVINVKNCFIFVFALLVNFKNLKMDQKAVVNIFNETIDKIETITGFHGPRNQLHNVLQSFLLNIQIYHTQLFNGLVCGMNTNTELLKNDIELPFTYSTANPTTKSDIQKVNKIACDKMTNLDDYELSEINLDSYNFENTEFKDINPDWKDLNDYINMTTNSEMNDPEMNDSDEDIADLGFQCCARLNKNKKYNLMDEKSEFVYSYPADVYIDSDNNIYGDPCSNYISIDLAQSGENYCWLHRDNPFITNICLAPDYDVISDLHADEA